MPAAKTHPVRRRDADGLMLDQRRLLQSLAEGVPPPQACQQENVEWGRFRHWLSEDAAFQQAFDGLVSNSVETARSLLEAMAVKAVRVFEDAVAHTKVIEVPVCCPDCGKEFLGQVETADMATRLRAGETVLKSTRLLKDVKEIGGTFTHLRASLTFEELLALAAAESGRHISPHLRTRFTQMGLLTEGKGDAVDGVFKEVPA